MTGSSMPGAASATLRSNLPVWSERARRSGIAAPVFQKSVAAVNGKDRSASEELEPVLRRLVAEDKVSALRRELSWTSWPPI